MRIISPDYLEILRPEHVQEELVLALESGINIILATQHDGTILVVTPRGESTWAQQDEIQNFYIKLYERPEAFQPGGEFAHMVRPKSEGPTE